MRRAKSKLHISANASDNTLKTLALRKGVSMDLQLLSGGIIGLATGLPMLLFARRTRLAARAKAESRMAQLSAGASQRYFEEARSLIAYPLPATDEKWRTRGLVFTTGGMILLGLSLLH
jgi:hypothetical protein